MLVSGCGKVRTVRTLGQNLRALSANPGSASRTHFFFNSVDRKKKLFSCFLLVFFLFVVCRLVLCCVVLSGILCFLLLCCVVLFLSCVLFCLVLSCLILSFVYTYVYLLVSCYHDVTFFLTSSLFPGSGAVSRRATIGSAREGLPSRLLPCFSSVVFSVAFPSVLSYNCVPSCLALPCLALLLIRLI
jgi:hypothetical protein